MRHSIRLTLAFLLASCFFCSAAPSLGQATDWNQIQAPPLRAFHPPVPVRIQLSNGMVIFLMEDHELPLVQGIAEIRGASRDEARPEEGQA